MRKIIWENEAGHKQVSLVRDDDPDSMASAGVPIGPPDLEELDWENIKRELNSMLIERGLLTWQNVQSQQNGITSVLLAVLKRPLVELFRAEHRRKTEE